MKTKPLPLLCVAAGGFLPFSLKAQIETDLVGYWQFEDDLTESSGFQPAGTHDGATTDGGVPEFTSGPTVIDDGVLSDFGQALDTDFDTGYGIFVLGSNSNEPGYVNTFDEGIDTEFSISVWARGFAVGNATRWTPFVAKRGEGSATDPLSGYQVRRRNNTNDATFTIRQTDGDDDPAVANGAGDEQPVWRHYLGTYNGVTGERKFYLDGDLIFTLEGDFESSGDPDADPPVPAGSVGAADNFWLTFAARHNNVDPEIFEALFAGQIDDVAFWHRELTAGEAFRLSTGPLSFVMTQTDNDSDGLVDSVEADFNTDDNIADTDGDGVSDLDEFRKGQEGFVVDGAVDDDPDGDGLLNSQETSGSANPFVNNVNTGTPGGNTGDIAETTDFCNPDSDGDGINDGDELSIDNGFVTNPNNTDTDGDTFSDQDELVAGTDPTDGADTPAIVDTLPINDDFEDGVLALGTFSTITGTVPQNGSGTVTGGTVEETGGCVQLGNRGYLFTSAQFDPEVVGGLEITAEVSGDSTGDVISILTRANPTPTNSFGEAESGIQFQLNYRFNRIEIVTRNGDHTLGDTTGTVPFTFAVGVFYTVQVIDDGVGGLSLTVTDRDNPATTATLTAELTADTSDFNHVIFYNREGGSRIASLCDLSIEANPTPVDLGGDIDEIVVVDCDFDADTEEFSITWVSQATETYAINASTDLVDFDIPIQSGIVGQAGTTTLSIDTSALTGDRIFFQISEE